jgi:PPE-repeat protein
LSWATAPAAIGAASHVGSLAGALGSPSLSGSAVSAGVGRATLVGAMSVPQSWAAAAPPGTSAPLMASSSGGWAIAPGAGTEAAGVPGMPGMPAMPVGGSGGRGFGFAAPRYGFRPTVVAHPPAAG